MGLDFHRIQAQLYASAQAIHGGEAVPPFTCFFNPEDAASYANCAMPDRVLETLPPQALDALVARFRGRARTPRVEYVEEYAPALGDLLARYGFALEERTFLMVCVPESLAAAPIVEGLTISMLTAEMPVREAQDFVTVQGRAFGDGTRALATPDEAANFLGRFHSVQKYLARLDGIPVGAGSLTKPHDGIAEIAGIGTLAAYRRRGIASAMTAHIARAGFQDGLSALFLTAADADAGRVYERVGFKPMGSVVSYVLDAGPVAATEE